ncbi:MAG TPA: hypothetical protein VH643_20900 [Gemmataceae bacterium]|jgi:hypothetical protein
MSTPQTTSAAVNSGTNGANSVFSTDVVAFAAAYQAENALQPLLDATHRIFPTAQSIKVSVEEDPELRDNTQIVFEVQVAGLSLDQSRRARRQWNEALLSIHRPTRKLLFCLLLKLKS